MRILWIISLFFWVSVLVFGQSKPGEVASASTKSFRFSQATRVATFGLDLASSWGKCCEINPMLPGGEFGGQHLATAIGIEATGLVLQELLVRKWPRLTKLFLWINYSWAGVHVLAAWHNWSLY